MGAERPGAPASTRLIEEDSAGQRIDNWLMRELKGWPRSQVYRLLRSGQVRVNSGRRKPDYRLRAGDRVRLPPQAAAGARGQAEGASAVPRALREQLAAAIIEQTPDLLVLDKPAGLAVHGGSGVSFGVIEGLRALYPDDERLELVHRLDRETSGCLLVARRRSCLKALHAQFREGTVEKRYLALVAGRWQRGRDIVDLPLDVRYRAGGERHVVVADTGKAAQTGFRLVEDFGQVSLLEVTPFTGRTHQIRVHAQAVGHPLVGDGRYGDPVVNEAMAELGLGRLFLHAHALAFVRPGTEVPWVCSAPLPPALARLLEVLGGPRRGGRGELQKWRA